MQEVIITSHAEHRLRKRIGLPARAVSRAAKNAYARGRKRTEFQGKLRKYLDKLHSKGKLQNAATDIIVYANTIFLFEGEFLITTWQVPREFL